jgi:hypothetical protein
VKAAQKGFTLSCAIGMAPHGGWAVSVSPGPREVAEIIVMAASRLGNPLTGQDIRATSGIEAGGFNLSYRTNPGAVPPA